MGAQALTAWSGEGFSATHTSKLIRKLGDSDLALTHNKVINLRLALASSDGRALPRASTFRSAGWSVASVGHQMMPSIHSRPR